MTPVPPFLGNIGFNAHHAPMGAFFTFTCGHPGTRGGLGLQLGRPAGQDLFIGVKDGGRRSSGAIRCLPFFEGAAMRENAQANFTPEAGAVAAPGEIRCYALREMTRHYGWGTDTWMTPDFEFTIYSPFGGIPEPAGADQGAMREALLPAVTAELRIDNRMGTAAKTAFFAVNFNETGVRLLEWNLVDGRAGFALRSHLGVMGRAVVDDGESELGAFPFLRWDVAEGLMAEEPHLLGATPGVGMEVPAGAVATLRLAIGCCLTGTVTTRLQGRYFYTRYFGAIEEVLGGALDRFDALRAACEGLDRKLLASGLSADQQFLVAHATRSYYGATQLLEVGGEPYWVVNEGEYCMMNTLDLAVDHVFWELEQNPWVVRNLLDNFVRRYSYHDQVKDPESGALLPGGISFCHDQGVHNQFSPLGTSAYELPNLTGCFSFMAQEELCNWILMAASYVAKTGDDAWSRSHQALFDKCVDSMTNRDPNETGLMKCDSALTVGGSEITTYDSLDPSLGQARDNLYIAVKRLAAWTGLYLLTNAHDEDLVYEYCMNVAAIAEVAVTSRLNSSGFLPAILESRDAPARILPAIEPLAYALYWKSVGATHVVYTGEVEGKAEWKPAPLDVLAVFTELSAALRTHTITLLSDAPRRNHFSDGGIRLSSTSDNSWASKIAIVQHVARSLFNLDENGRERTAAGAGGWDQADAAHVRWQVEGASAYWAASDQIVNGVARGSKYYPRLITAALWLREK